MGRLDSQWFGGVFSTRKPRRASYEMVTNWIHEKRKKVATPAYIIDGFRQCGYIELNGDHQNLHSRLRDTILNREVPIETILEVNEMLCQLEEANNNDDDDDDDLI